MAAKRYGIPLCRHFELDPLDAPATTLSIGLDEPDVMVAKALEFPGFPMYKVKLDRATDPSVVKRIKEATGAAVTVDANCGWTRDEAVRKLAVLADYGVEFVEQPVAADDIEGLRFVRERSAVPIFADESCPTSARIPALEGLVDGIVVKLMKCGGLVEAVRMARDARARGMKTMIGCMIESSLAITAAAHIAPLMDYADLDSGLLLENDPYVGVTIDRGRMTLPDEPGLGVHPAGEGGRDDGGKGESRAALSRRRWTAGAIAAGLALRVAALVLLSRFPLVGDERSYSAMAGSFSTA